MNHHEVKNESNKTDAEQELANLDNIEIQPLADEDLDSVAGGYTCSHDHCSNSPAEAAM